jgi:hypothetical protein
MFMVTNYQVITEKQFPFYTLIVLKPGKGVFHDMVHKITSSILGSLFS